MNTEEIKRPRDVSPDPETDLTMQPPPGGGSAESITPPPKKKGILGFVNDVLHGGDIEQKKAEKQRVLQEAQARATQNDMEVAKLESEAIERARQSDPQYRAQVKQQEAFFKARHAEARRLASLNEMITEYERRHPCKDESAISFYESQIDRESLWGVFSKKD